MTFDHPLLDPASLLTTALAEPAPAKPGVGYGLTLWNDKRPDTALAVAGARALLVRARPEVVCVHASPRAILGEDPDERRNKGAGVLLDAVKAATPGATLYAGLGCDGWTRGYAAASTDAGRGAAVAMVVRAVDYVAARGVGLVIYDLEDAGEKLPDAARALGARVIAAVAARHPGLVQGFTSFPLYTSHHALPFAAWHVPPVLVTFPQLYPVLDRDARPGELEALVKRHKTDKKRSVAEGLVPATVQWQWYLRAKGCVPAETVRVCRAAGAPSMKLFWNAPAGLDDKGPRALITLCDLARLDAATGADKRAR